MPEKIWRRGSPLYLSFSNLHHASPKLLGFLAEKTFEGGKTPKPCPIPTDVVEMDEKTWLEMFRPKTLVR